MVSVQLLPLKHIEAVHSVDFDAARLLWCWTHFNVGSILPDYVQLFFKHLSSHCYFKKKFELQTDGNIL